MKIAALLFLLVLLGGCGFTNKSVIDLSNESLRETETARAVGKNIISNWKLDSALVRGMLGVNIKMLPQDVVDAMDDLDIIAQKTTPLEDGDYGMAIGLTLRIWTSIAIQVVKQYAPAILQYIPAIIGIGSI